MKRRVIIITSVVLLVYLVLMACLLSRCERDDSFVRMEYRQDTAPIVKRFGEKFQVEACYWKAESIGNTRIGPTSLRWNGFALIDEGSLQALLDKYTFYDAEPTFPNGIDPEITGCTPTRWVHSDAMSSEFVGVDFVGEFYLDIEHRILYFDLETM